MKYYIITPGGHKTGGTELAHQLVYKLNNKGINAQIAYSECNKDGVYLHPAFKEYVDNYVRIDEIEDTKENTLIFSETLTALIPSFKHCNIWIWWMSVDNYYNGRNLRLVIKEKGVVRALVLNLLSTIGVFPKKKKYLKMHDFGRVSQHLVQSEYARVFLEKNGITNVKFLTDYINRSYVEKSKSIDLAKKENIVLYNPSKGRRFTKKIMAVSKDISFVQLYKLTNDEVIEYMKKAKVYIDFGNHPGKDRLPREAAMMKCCIITGKRGAAGYYNDIPIEDRFKFDEKKSSIPKIHDRLLDVFDNYLDDLKSQENYRLWISEEEERFDNEIDDVFMR